MTDPTVPQPEQPEQPITPPPPPAYQPPVYQAPGYQQPGYQQPGYPPQGYAQAGYAPAGPRTNTLAIVALILGFVVPLGGIICGHIALGQIKRTGEGGHGLALAGAILGYVFTALTILYIVFIVVIGFAAVGSAGGFDPSNY
jgi:hypothetical protein